MDVNLLQKLGERILQAAGIEFIAVGHVDLNYEYYRGWSEYTPADWEFPVTVYYDGKRYEKSYRSLPPIIRELEAITDEVQDRAYEQ